MFAVVRFMIIFLKCNRQARIQNFFRMGGWD